MPKLAARFEVEAKMEGFDENAFTRRLATLVGVESIDPKAVSLNKYTANPDTFAIDVEIACPDATTLVMAAKTLKKAAGPLGPGRGHGGARMSEWGIEGQMLQQAATRAEVGPVEAPPLLS